MNVISTEEAFNRIYKESVWGHKSGSGSDPKNASPWIDLVNQYLERDDLHTLLDVGCGDGRLMAHYRLEGKQYLGVDVSSEVMKDNVERDGVTFKVDDVMSMEIQETDLIIIKDVLQHLPIPYIQQIVPKLMSKAKVVLFCNDIAAVNTDITVGGYRGIDLKADPFNFDLKVLFDFTSNTEVKRVHLYERELHV